VGAPPAEGVRGVTPGNFFKIFDAKSRIWGQFGPENKLIKGQPDEYDVICRNASVLAFHLWSTILNFAGAPFRLQNICRNSVLPRSSTTAPPIVCIIKCYLGTPERNWCRFAYIRSAFSRRAELSNAWTTTTKHARSTATMNETKSTFYPHEKCRSYVSKTIFARQ